jgi:hypothetical protein
VRTLYVLCFFDDRWTEVFAGRCNKQSTFSFDLSEGFDVVWWYVVYVAGFPSVGEELVDCRRELFDTCLNVVRSVVWLPVLVFHV